MALNYVDAVRAAIREAISPSLRPDEDAEELYRLYALLALTVGINVTHEQVHDAWSLWMDRRDPDHESIKPFAELDPDTRGEDTPFVDAIRFVAISQRRTRDH